MRNGGRKREKSLREQQPPFQFQSVPITQFLLPRIPIFSLETGGVKDDSPVRHAVETGIRVGLISKKCDFCGHLCS